MLENVHYSWSRELHVSNWTLLVAFVPSRRKHSEPGKSSISISVLLEQYRLFKNSDTLLVKSLHVPP